MRNNLNMSDSGMSSDQHSQSTLQFVGISWIVEFSTLSQATIYRLIKAQKLPAGYMITPNRRVWKKDEVVAAIYDMLSKPRD